MWEANGDWDAALKWFAARRGKVTASRIADLSARTKSGWGASRGNYMSELIVERLTDTTADSYTNAAMQWGIETEPLAVEAYEFQTANLVDYNSKRFTIHPRIAMSGASPDGLVDGGLIEVKCPQTKTHIDTLLSGKVAGNYQKQIQWQLACEDRDWCDFISFDPRMPADMRLWIKRIERDDNLILELEEQVEEFLEELEGKILALTEWSKNNE